MTRPHAEAGAYYADGQATLMLGDTRAVLRELQAESVSCVITSPPYWSLRDYSIPPSVWGGEPDCAHEWGDIVLGGESYTSRKRWQHEQTRDDNPEGWQKGTPQGQFCRHCSAWFGCLGLEPDVDLFVAHLVEVFREVRRVMHPSSTLWVNLGDSYVGGGGFSPTAPSTATSKSGRYGSLGALKEGGIKATGSLKPKDLCMAPARFALAMQADGWWLRQEITLCKVAPMPESVTDRCTSATEKLYLFAKQPRYYFDSDAIREKYAGPMYEGRDNGAIRNGDRNDNGRTVGMSNPAGRNARNWWLWSPDGGFDGAHFATFPLALPKRCILAGTSERGVCSACRAPWVRTVEREKFGKAYSATKFDDTTQGGPLSRSRQAYRAAGLEGPPPAITTGWSPGCRCAAPTVPAVVLDPFAGSCTTGLAARQLGRNAVLIDRSEDYLKMGIGRLSSQAMPMQLWGDPL